MALPNQVLLDVLEAKAYLSNLNEITIQKRKDGCVDCGCSDTETCLRRLIFALDNSSVVTDNVLINYNNMMYIIGGIAYSPEGPLVSLGSDRSSLTTVPQTFIATITERTYPIASILWSIAGGSATISGQGTDTVVISDFPVGDIEITATVTDTDGNATSDTVKLTGLYAMITVLFGYSDTDPFGNENVPTLQFSKEVVLQSPQYSLDFTNASNLHYLIIKEPSSEPIKTIWINTVYIEGEIPDSIFRSGVVIGGFRYYISRNVFSIDPETQVITFKTL